MKLSTMSIGLALLILALAVPAVSAAPDLIIRTVDGPSDAFMKTEVVIDYHIKNIGADPAKDFILAFFLSKDNQISTSDIMLGQVKVASLGPGASKKGSVSLLIPRVIGKRGIKYYIGAVVDSSMVVKESNEWNNSGFDRDKIVIR